MGPARATFLLFSLYAKENKKMIYITMLQHRKPRQLTWEDVIADKINFSDFANDESNSTATITKKCEKIDDAILKKINVQGMINWLKKFNQDNDKLFCQKREDLYYTFKIPKNSGGFRRIDAPNDELQAQLRRLVKFFSDDCGIMYHTSAFAYIKGRSIIDCLKKHQKNESNWYLKTDISGFFPNTTLEFVMKMAAMIFPLSEICKSKEGYDELKKALSLGFLNEGLPQGTALSPNVTTWMYLPIDFELFNELAHRNMVYTRYADDMLISAKSQFPYKEIVELIKSVLKKFEAPHELKKEKIRFGSRKGKNWNLGLMIGQENNISVGYRTKKYFKAALCSFILDTKNKKYWELDDVYHLRGQLSYYTMVEKEYFEKIINQQNNKWHVDVKQMFKEYINGSCA